VAEATDLTHENIMKQAANLDVTLPLMLPGIKLKTSPTDYYPIECGCRSSTARYGSCSAKRSGAIDRRRALATVSAQSPCYSQSLYDATISTGWAHRRSQVRSRRTRSVSFNLLFSRH
jgi:hypothetical protein